MRRLAVALGILTVLAASCARPAPEEAPPAATVAPPDSMVRLATPQPGEAIASPLRVAGEARGRWYFEASFPVHLLDGDGRELAVVPAQAQGEWMTTEFVPFEATLTFVPPAGGGAGTLVLEKDNASGLPEHADERRFPVRFAPARP